MTANSSLVSVFCDSVDIAAFDGTAAGVFLTFKSPVSTGSGVEEVPAFRLVMTELAFDKLRESINEAYAAIRTPSGVRN